MSIDVTLEEVPPGTPAAPRPPDRPRPSPLNPQASWTSILAPLADRDRELVLSYLMGQHDRGHLDAQPVPPETLRQRIHDFLARLRTT